MSVFRSLRARLALGTALVAILPVAASLLVLSIRIESAVRAESEKRLDASLDAIEAEFKGLVARTGQRLEILARDPQLRRLFLVGAPDSRELRDYLEERRILLGLDFLAVESSGASPRHTPFPEPVRATGTERFLGASAPIRYRGENAGILAGGVLLSDSLAMAWARSAGIELVVRDFLLAKEGRAAVLASSIPAREADGLRGAGLGRVQSAGRGYFQRNEEVDITYGPHLLVTGLVSTESVDRSVASLRVAAALLGLVAVTLAILLAAIWSAQIARPVERLAAFSDRVARGEWDEPLTLKSVQELESLVGALDRMREDLRTYRDRLRTSERQAAWGQMARKVAHEIKNPLTPIAVSVEDLKRSYQQGRPDFPEILTQATRTIAEEVESMKRMLQELSEFGRLPAPRFESCAWGRLAANLEALYRRDVAERRLCVAHPSPDIAFRADPGQIQQALVNLIQNGFDAAGAGGHVKVSAAAANSILEIAVADDGPGLTPEQRQSLFVPGFTTKEHGSGLGLTIVERIVNDHGGSIDVRSEPGDGATIVIRLPLSAPSS